jgi:hypothetical protein
LAENIHEQLFKFPTEGMFWYSSILAYLFVFFQTDKFLFSMQKLDQNGKPQLGHILDFIAEEEFIRIHFQSIHRSVLPSCG